MKKITINNTEEITKNIDIISFILGKRKSILIEIDKNAKEINVEQFIHGLLVLLNYNIKKPFYYTCYSQLMFISSSNKKIELIENVLKKCTKRKTSSDDYCIKFHYSVGKFLDFPECCIKYYLESLLCYRKQVENVFKSSEFSSIRHLDNIKGEDKFEVELVEGGCYYKYFIPCNPNCKKALKLIKKWGY